MLISGNTFQNIYPQTGNFFFQVDIAVPTLTGACSFGFSGSNGPFDFTFVDGKVIYPNQQIVSYYNAGEKISISGFVTPDSGFLVVRNKAFNISNSGNYYNYFYINPTNCTVDISVNIDGETPTWVLDSSGCFRSGEPINFDIIFDESQTQFRIFSGAVVFPTGFGMSGINPLVDIVSGATFQVLTNDLVYNSSGANAVYPLIMIFNTNYGNVTQNYTVFKYNSVEDKFTVIPSDSPVILEKNSYQVFNVKALDFSPSGFSPVPLLISLDYVSGSGHHFGEYEGTVEITGGLFVSGAIIGSGFLTGLYQSTITLPSGNCATGTIPVSGIMSIQAFGGTGSFTATGYAIATGVGWGSSVRPLVCNTQTTKTVSGLYSGGFFDVVLTNAVFVGTPNPYFSTETPSPATIGVNNCIPFPMNSLIGQYFFTGSGTFQDPIEFDSSLGVFNPPTIFDGRLEYRGFHAVFSID